LRQGSILFATPASILAAVLLTTVALVLLISGRQGIPQFETAPITQFRMGPLGPPVSQTVQVGDFTLNAIDLRLTSRSDLAVPVIVRVVSVNSSSTMREALVEVPPQVADVWTRVDFAPIRLHSDDSIEFKFFLPEQQAGAIYLGTGLQDQYPEGTFTDHDGIVHVGQDISIRIWAESNPLEFFWLLIRRDPFGSVFMILLLGFLGLGVYAEYARWSPRFIAVSQAVAVPLFAFALMYRLPEFSF